MAQRLINRFGEMTSWNSVRLHLLGRSVEGIVEISYMMEQEKENMYGVGTDPIGQSRGNRTCKFSISLTMEERMALNESIPPGKTLMDIDPFDVPVSFMYGTKVYTDVIRNCGFKNDGVETKQNDKSIVTKYEMIASHIETNVK